MNFEVVDSESADGTIPMADMPVESIGKIVRSTSTDLLNEYVMCVEGKDWATKCVFGISKPGRRWFAEEHMERHFVRLLQPGEEIIIRGK